MAANSGNLFVLSIETTASPQAFSQIGGLRPTSMSLNNAPVDVTTKDSNHYRTLLSGGGAKSLDISAGGVFVDASADETLRVAAFAGTLKNFELEFGNGDTIKGAFLVTAYERSGANDDSEQFSISLQSSGEWTFTAGV